jgi:hypothetical protein
MSGNGHPVLVRKIHRGFRKGPQGNVDSVLRAALTPRCSLVLDKSGQPLWLRKSWGPSGDGTFLAKWWQSGPRRQGFVDAAPNPPLDSASFQRNADERQEFFNQAMARSLRPIDSHTNFVMMDTFHPAEEVIEHFRKNNILLGNRFPPMDTCIQISLGRT